MADAQPDDNMDSILVEKGCPSPPVQVVIAAAAYTQLITMARTHLPGTTIGALIGRTYRTHMCEWLSIHEIVLLEVLNQQAQHLYTGKIAWQKLHIPSPQTRIPGLAPIGWFYADAGLRLFPPRSNLVTSQQDLTPTPALLLVLNPSAGYEAGGFYLWQKTRFIPLEGFWEAVSQPGSPASIPWTGVVPGLEQWLEVPPRPDPRIQVPAVADPRAVNRPKPPATPLDLAQGLYTLARQLADQGEQALARPFYEQALMRCEAVLGPDHPLVLTGLCELAELLVGQGQIATAQALVAQAWTILPQQDREESDSIPEDAVDPADEAATTRREIAALLAHLGFPAPMPEWVSTGPVRARTRSA